MAVTVRHATLTAVPDDPAYDVGADEWNEYHTVTNAVDKTGDTMTGQMTVAQGTITTSQPFTWTQTWNAGAVTFTGVLFNVTDTASATGSMLVDWQVGGVSKASVEKNGVLWGKGAVIGGALAASPTTINYYSGGVRFSSASQLEWTNGNANSTLDTALARNAAGVVEANNGSAGTYRDLKARNVITNPSTVAGLAAAAQGARAFVTDATQTLTAGIGAIVAGGGANAVPVHYDGTNWRIG